jgi:transposase InsO family protein
MVEKHLGGMRLEDISNQMGLNYYSVRHWWRAYRDGGWEALRPVARQRPGKGTLSTFEPMVRYVALRMKRERPNWGPDLLLLKMRQRPSLAGKRLPSRSALADYLKPYLLRIKGRHRAVAQRPAQTKTKAKAAHECWQMDFKGAEHIGQCGKVAPFMVTDMYTSAPLQTVVHPGSLKGVTWRTVQRDLRATFACWGLPAAIRMDRASVFVGSNSEEWPGSLRLWLIGLGVYPIVNDAGRPTQNAQVERQNRTWMDHVAVGANHNIYSEVQQATDTARHERLYLLPSRNPACNGHPPMVACPELSIPHRSFDPAKEEELFDFENVELYLSDWRMLRQVDKVGRISLADEAISVGRSYYQQTVEVTYDLDEHAFVARTYDKARTLLCYFTLSAVNREHIMGLNGTGTAGGG